MSHATHNCGSLRSRQRRPTRARARHSRPIGIPPSNRALTGRLLPGSYLPARSCFRVRPRSPLRQLEGVVEEIQTVLRDLQNPRSLALCGISVGWLGALRLAKRYPDQLLDRKSRLNLGVNLWSPLSPPKILSDIYGCCTHCSRGNTAPRPSRTQGAASPARSMAVRDVAAADVFREAAFDRANGPPLPTDCLGSIVPTTAAVCVARRPLLITGEPHLDYSSPADGVRVSQAHCQRPCNIVLERTGHLGSITRPEAFYATVRRNS